MMQQEMAVMSAFANPLPELTLPQMLREQARRQGGRIAIRQKDFGIWKPLTWADYLRRASHFGLGLRALGLARGGHVGVISENRIEWVLAQMGSGLIGAVTVGVYPTSPSNEVAYVVGHADIEIMVCEDQEQTDKVLAALDQLPRLRRSSSSRPRACAATRRPSASASSPSPRSRRRPRAAGRGRRRPHRRRAGRADAGRHRPDDLHLGLHRQAQGRDDLLAQHPRRGAGHRRAAAARRAAPRTCPTCRCATWPSRC